MLVRHDTYWYIKQFTWCYLCCTSVNMKSIAITANFALLLCFFIEEFFYELPYNKKTVYDNLLFMSIPPRTRLIIYNLILTRLGYKLNDKWPTFDTRTFLP